jgi:hypothetical protein
MGNPSERGLQRQPKARNAEKVVAWLEKAMIVDWMG